METHFPAARPRCTELRRARRAFLRRWLRRQAFPPTVNGYKPFSQLVAEAMDRIARRVAERYPEDVR